MLIGIDASHAVKEQRTGVEEVCWQVIENLKKEIPSDVRVVLYSHKIPTDKLVVLPTNWEWKIISWPFKKLWTQGALAFELIKNPPDIFFSPGQILPWYVSRKTAVFLHDSAFLFFKSAYNFWGRQYLCLMNWWIVKRASLIITSTEFNRSELVRYYGSSVEKKIQLVPLAYDKEKYNESTIPLSNKELLEKFNISKSFALFVGRLEGKKNVRFLIQAFNRAREKKDFQLVLSGRPGCGFIDINREIELSPFKKDILLLGWVEAKDLPCLVRSATVLVFPSFYEGFGLPILEAMAVGVPVLASDIPALREVGDEAVFFVEPKNVASISSGLEYFFSNPENLMEMVKKGKERVLGFSWEKTASKIAKMLLF
jgi:glycosyltransferase involved in cell wall biosynthesis